MEAHKLGPALLLLVSACACEMAGQCTLGKEGAGCPAEAFCYAGENAKPGDKGVCTLSALALHSFEPLEASHGATLTLRGNHFSTVLAENHVTFNGIAAQLLSATPGEITVRVPKNTRCSGPIAVRVAGRTAVSAAAFTYVPTGGAVSTAVGDGTQGVLSAPTNTAIDADGNLYVADYANNRIRLRTPQGAFSTFAGDAFVSGHHDDTGESALLGSPWGIVLDAEGNLYITDVPGQENQPSCHCIRRVSAQAVASTFVGNGQSFAINPENYATFDSPRGIVRDKEGNLYVAEMGKHRILKISPQWQVSSLAGSGTAGFADGQGALAQFNSPRGMAMDAAGNLYVADRSNNRIRKVSPDGLVTTLAGERQGFVQNPSNPLYFELPHGLTLDKGGHFLYVAETGNHRIYQITPGGRALPFAGNGTAGFADTDTALAAQFNAPRGLTMDVDGHLYVADYSNNRIRKISLE